VVREIYRKSAARIGPATAVTQQPLPLKLQWFDARWSGEGADMQSFIIGYLSLSLLVTALWVRPPRDCEWDTES
jgi:hypothetical protein